MVWLYCRRPLLFLLVLCSGISVMTTGRFSLDLVGSTAIYWSFLPLIETLALAVAEHKWPQANTVDRFFMGFGPWMLFAAAFAGYAAFVPESAPDVLSRWGAAAGVILLWCLWIDYRFFGSLRKLVLHRAVSWLSLIHI